ncbi:protein of unknown function [Methylocaldum szegediense]|uniref:Transposase n=1 Tax=Methylocaldum szegediense TaxID=73780 RepID=A0ABM9I467_9GAMM|nr:protein of unknown function [Methylocaldum szegediense]
MSFHHPIYVPINHLFRLRLEAFIAAIDRPAQISSKWQGKKRDEDGFPSKGEERAWVPFRATPSDDLRSRTQI